MPRAKKTVEEPIQDIVSDEVAETLPLEYETEDDFTEGVDEDSSSEDEYDLFEEEGVIDASEIEPEDDDEEDLDPYQETDSVASGSPVDESLSSSLGELTHVLNCKDFKLLEIECKSNRKYRVKCKADSLTIQTELAFPAEGKIRRPFEDTLLDLAIVSFPKLFPGLNPELLSLVKLTRKIKNSKNKELVELFKLKAYVHNGNGSSVENEDSEAQHICKEFRPHFDSLEELIRSEITTQRPMEVQKSIFEEVA